MRKIVIHRPGSFGRLKIESFPDPTPNEKEVLIKTKAIGINYADCVVRMGLYASAKKYVGWPITPGFDFSGEVIARGKDVRDLELGTAVFGVTRFNGYSTHVVVPRDQVFTIPQNVSFSQAAGFPTIYLTAYYALHLTVKIFPGSVILVHSAAGGVGSALLQLSKAAGWRTIGVVGSSLKVESAIKMGADVVIDRSNQDLWKEVEAHVPEGCDVILDGNGASTLKQGFKHLKPTGKLIAYGFHSMFPKKHGVPNYLKLLVDYLRTPRFSPLSMHIKNKSLVTFNLSFLFDRKDLLQITMKSLKGMLEEGAVKLPEITEYPFDSVIRAHKDLQSGTTKGKLVLIP
jgi:NADPH:quinone reductase-like Zn-dependent oxidoreductase